MQPPKNRGEIYEIDLPKGVGSEQHGKRYGVVIQNNSVEVSTVVIVPTSMSAGDATYRPTITIEGEETRVMVEQMRSLDHKRFKSCVGNVTVHELTAIENALDLVLDLGTGQF